jgi:hypothetical protein
VRHVGKDPAEDVVVCEFEEGAVNKKKSEPMFSKVRLLCNSRTDVDTNLTGDVDGQVLVAVQVVERAILPQSVAGREQDGAERVQPDQLPGIVVAVKEFSRQTPTQWLLPLLQTLIDVADRRHGERDDEEDGRSLVGGVDKETVGHCRQADTLTTPGKSAIGSTKARLFLPGCPPILTE